MSTAAPARPAIAWSWSNALLGVAYAVPAAVVSLNDPAAGYPLAVGMVVGASLGVMPRRSQRRLVVVVGALAGASMALGAFVSPWPVLAVATIFAVCLVASVTRWSHRLGPVVLSMGVPLVGAGLSEAPSDGVTIALLLVLGSVYAWLVSLAWPERTPPARPGHGGPAPARAPRRHLVDYGIRLGLVGAVGASLGFALGWDHPGWAACAGLIVSRPDIELTKLRGTGRTLSVIVGATFSLVVQAIGPSPVGVCVISVVVLALATGTSGSRWYITSAFTTFLVLGMLTADDPTGGPWWFVERILATLIGVGLSYLFMVLVPALRERRAGEPMELALQ